MPSRHSIQNRLADFSRETRQLARKEAIAAFYSALLLTICCANNVNAKEFQNLGVPILNSPLTTPSDRLGSNRRALSSVFAEAAATAASPIATEKLTLADNSLAGAVDLLGVEAVQSIQNADNSVKLIAGKRTWIRAYLTAKGDSIDLTATLRASRGALSVDISPASSIIASSTDSLDDIRATWSKALNFQVPDTLTAPGETAFQLINVRRTDGEMVQCTSCLQKSVVFLDSLPAIVRAIGFEYQSNTSSSPVVASPRQVDFVLLGSWIARAYPVPNVEFTSNTIPMKPETASQVFAEFNKVSDDVWSCNAINQDLLLIEDQEFCQGANQRTHYLGLVPNTDGFMRGCAAGSVAALPTGPTDGNFLPKNAAGDTDGTFADWYGGHELAHTFGRAHPGCCGQDQGDLNQDHFPGGLISDSVGKYNGLDVGADNLAVGSEQVTLPLTILTGGDHYDVMSYCQQALWLSPQTYEGIRVALNSEHSGAPPEVPVGSSTSAASYIHVVGSVDIKSSRASIDFAIPEACAPEVSATGDNAVLGLVDNSGNMIVRKAARVLRLSDSEGRSPRAIVEASVPFDNRAVEIRLLLNNTVAASFGRVGETPAPVKALAVSNDHGTRRVYWQAGENTRYERYVVEGTTDDRTWRILSIGGAETSLLLTKNQGTLRTVRVTATNGFKLSRPSSVELLLKQP